MFHRDPTSPEQFQVILWVFLILPLAAVGTGMIMWGRWWPGIGCLLFAALLVGVLRLVERLLDL
jgi:hypothetical protein